MERERKNETTRIHIFSCKGYGFNFTYLNPHRRDRQLEKIIKSLKKDAYTSYNPPCLLDEATLRGIYRERKENGKFNLDLSRMS